MKKGFLLFCITLFLTTAAPGYSAFSPEVKGVVSPASAREKTALQPIPFEAFTTFQTGSKVQKQQRLGFWKRLKIKLLHRLLPTEGEKQLLAFVLGIFLGLFGMHRFYLNYKGEGFAYLVISLLSLLSILFGFLMFIFIPPLGVFLIGSGVVLLSGLTIWLIVDLIRIAVGTLRPRENL